MDWGLSEGLIDNRNVVYRFLSWAGITRWHMCCNSIIKGVMRGI